VLYGPALAPRLLFARKARAALAAFGLTDEVFAVAFSKSSRRPVGFLWVLCLGACAYASWLAGTYLGASAGPALVGALPSLAPALSFALPSLFVALLMPALWPGKLDAPVAVSVAGAGVVAGMLYLAGLEGLSVLAAGVVGPVFGISLQRWSGR
jgi:predicted branched-subunit amino acid permease